MLIVMSGFNLNLEGRFLFAGVSMSMSILMLNSCNVFAVKSCDLVNREE